MRHSLGVQQEAECVRIVLVHNPGDETHATATDVLCASQVHADVRSVVAMRAHRDYRPHVGMYLARTEYVRRSGVRFIPGIVHQDNPYTFRLLLHAERVAHAKSDIYARRIRPGSTITALDSSRSAKGYFLSYVEMMRELRLHDTSPEIMARLCDVVHGVFDGAQKAASGLSSRELADLAALDAHPDAQLTLRAIATSSGRR